MGGNASTLAHRALVLSASWRGKNARVRRAVAGAFLGAVVAAAPVSAGTAHEGYDLIFRTGTLAEFAAGEALQYQSETLNEAAPPEVQGTQSYDLRIEEDGTARLIRVLEEGQQAVAGFDAGVGNPMAMFFLERLVRDLAQATGGSTFYIRNRIKESLLAPEGISPVQVTWAGQSHAAQEVVLAPFVDDQNAARLGPFAALRVVFDVSGEVPGWYHSMRAETPERESGGRYFASTLRLMEAAE
ncbi:MAG: hypothetical protein ACU0DX_12220 [Roseovarius sp.]|uniref:hypothetical protein n=1 Tax=Pseudomonadota TaxID=1224 RepID=UPI002634A384|nr:hypothetical protein [Roseovarius sp.]